MNNFQEQNHQKHLTNTRTIITLVVLLVCLSFAANAQPMTTDLGSMFYLSSKTDYYVFATKANIHSAPKADSQIIDQLKSGETVQVKRTSIDFNNVYTSHGITSPWAEIVYASPSGEKSGYIWLANLAISEFKISNSRFLLGIDSRITKKADNKEVYCDSDFNKYIFKGFVNDSLQITYSFLDNNFDTSFSEIRIMSGMGLTNLKNIIRFGTLGEACGVPSNYYYFGWNGQKIIPLPSRYEVGDAGSFHHSEKIIFPKEKGGKPNTIIKIIENYEFNEKKNDYVKTENKRKTFFWKGSGYIEN